MSLVVANQLQIIMQVRPTSPFSRLPPLPRGRLNGEMEGQAEYLLPHEPDQASISPARLAARVRSACTSELQRTG